MYFVRYLSKKRLWMKKRRNRFFANLMAAWLIKDDNWKRVRRDFSLQNSVNKAGDIMDHMRRYLRFVIKYMRENRNIKQAFRKYVK